MVFPCQLESSTRPKYFTLETGQLLLPLMAIEQTMDNILKDLTCCGKLTKKERGGVGGGMTFSAKVVTISRECEVTEPSRCRIEGRCQDFLLKH